MASTTELHLMPFYTAILHVNVTIVPVFLELTAKFFQRLHDRFSLLGIMNMLGFPLC